MADRREDIYEVQAPSLPAFAKPHAPALLFVERIEPSALALEDADSARLVARLQGGETALFGVLYLRYFDRVYAHLRAYLDDHHEAEDVTQDVFVRVLAALPRYERRSQPFRAWLFRIAHNCAATSIRKSRRAVPLAPRDLVDRIDSAGAVDESLDWLSDRRITRLLERLPSAQRQALVLGGLIGLSGQEIAGLLGRSPASVRQLQRRGVQTVRTRLCPSQPPQARAVVASRLR